MTNRRTVPPGIKRAGALARAPQPLALRPGALQTVPDTLRDTCPPELGDRAQGVHLKLPGGRSRVDALSNETNETPKAWRSSSSPIKCVRFRPESIQAPAHDSVESSAFIIGQPIECGASVLAPLTLRSTSSTPSPNPDVPLQFLRLIIWFLIERADTRVDHPF